jgi:hypothetical protein
MSNSRVNVPPNPQPQAAPPAAPNAYRPSVPISVYRELASELHRKDEQLNLLQVQNQQLVQHNQRLRQEVEKLGAWAQKVQELTASYDAHGKPIERPTPPVAQPSLIEPQPQPPVSPQPSVAAKAEEKPERRPAQTETQSDVSGWLLGIAIALIILVCFGTGFLIMRPLLTNQDNKPELPQEQDVETP